MNKVIASAEAMKIITDSKYLKDDIKKSVNYTTNIRKKFLSSKVVSEDQKYNAGLPCYLYLYTLNKKISSALGGFSFAFYPSNVAFTEAKWNTTYDTIVSGANTYGISISNNKIHTKDYNYVEIYYRHYTNHSSLYGTNILGFGNDQSVNFSVYNSETFSTIETASTLTTDIRNYNSDGYLKIRLHHGGQVSDHTVYTYIHSIALY